MGNSSLFFIHTKTNKNSLMALAGAIEKSPLPNLQLNFASSCNQIKANKDAIIAFSFMTPDLPEIKKEIANLKQKLEKEGKKVILIAGGPHPSGTPEHTLKMGFDYSFVGEGEESLVDFLLNWQKNKLPTQKIIRSKPVDITQYPAVCPQYNLFGPIEISRGCPFGCYFCQTTYLFGPLCHRTIPQIVWAAKQMASQGLTDIRFVTPNLLAYGSKTGLKPNLKKLEEMLSAVRNIKKVKQIFAGSFPSEIRPEQISKRGLTIIKKYCDNDNIIIGVQSGSNRMLKICHRGHTTDDIYRATGLALEAGFKVNVDFIFGMPGETREDEEKTIEMIEKLIKKPGVRIHGHFFIPLPGTPWENKKPSKISPKLREYLLDLRKRGKEYGDWQKQEKLT